MTGNNLMKKIAIVLSSFVLFSCRSQTSAPNLSCPAVITIRQGTTFNYKKYCDVDGRITATQIDTEVLGVQTMTVTSEKDGSVSIYKVKVNVVKGEDAVLDVSEEKKENEFVPCEEGTHRENGVCVTNKTRPTPEPSPTPSETPDPEPESPVEEPETIPAAEPETKHDEQPVPAPSSETYQEEPVYVQPDIGHGVKYFAEYDYGDIFGAMNACRMELDSMAYGRCDPSEDETYYILTW